MLRLWRAVADWWTGRWGPKVFITPVVTGVRVVHGEGGAVTNVVVSRAMMELSAYAARACPDLHDAAEASPPAGGGFTTLKEKAMGEQLAAEKAERAKWDERLLVEAAGDAAYQGKLEWSKEQNSGVFVARHGEYEVRLSPPCRVVIIHRPAGEGTAVVLAQCDSDRKGRLYDEVVRQYAVAQGGVALAANAFQRLAAGL